MKIAHISDLHLRPIQYHKEYRQVFKKTKEILEQKKPDVIVLTGDIYHSKLQLSPEYIDLCSELFQMLSEDEKVHVLVLLGNHDGVLSNRFRQDAVSPIVHLLNRKNIQLLKKSGEYHFGHMINGKKVIFNVLSPFDKENWQQISNKEDLNIALYHGSISGCQTDTGFHMEFGENDISIFDGFDYALLGDIHKSNQRLDPDGRIRYAGSFVQQNHGETDDKGFLLWEINGKNDFKVKHIIINNPKPFKTIFLEEDGSYKKEEIPKNARLRVISEHNLPSELTKKTLDAIAYQFKPESLSFINKGNDKTTKTIQNENFDVSNLSDLAIQEKLIKEFLENFEVDDETLKSVCLMNKKYHEKLQKQNYYDNIHYEILELSWDNFGKFQEGNSLHFSKLDGVAGIFGRNFIGKSSIIEAILYCLSGGSAKPAKKVIDLINHDKDYCFVKMKIRIGNQIFTIERKSEKFIKRLHGKETEEAKTSVEFYVEDQILGTRKDLNGEDVWETNREIARYFGSLDDFLLTTVSSQEEPLAFLKHTSTIRKELLSKFLGVDSFKKKFDFANIDAKQAKALLKKFKETNFDQLIEETQHQLHENEKEIARIDSSIGIWKDTIKNKQEEMKDFDENFKKFVELDELLEDEEKEKSMVEILKDARMEISDKIGRVAAQQVAMKQILEQFDIEKIKEEQEISGKLELELAKIEANVKEINTEMKHLTKNAQILKEVPCGDQFPTCKFIKNAHEAKNAIDLVVLNRENLLKDLEIKKNEVKKLNIEQIKQKILQYEKLQKDFHNISRDIDKISNDLLNNKSDLLQNLKNLRRTKQEIRRMKKNGVDLSKKETIFKEKQEVDEKIKKMIENIEQMTKKLFELHSKNGSLKERLENLHVQKKDYEKLNKEVEIFDLYLKCAHPNGISYFLIKKSLPIVNQELQNILSSKVDFEVFFDGTDDDKLEIFVRRKGKKSTPIEVCSGAERVISSAAIRLAFLSVSSIPRGNIFVLDEPATALDSESMEGFIQMIDIIKGYFKNVLLISHLDSLKDVADSFIDIQITDDGFSTVGM